jgi:Uma2 family endonuclease
MLREAPVKTAMTFAEFLEFEKDAQERHEFVDGNLFVVAGGTTRHSGIILLLTGMLVQQAIKRGFLLCHDVLVKTPSGRGYYPDLYVVPINVPQKARVHTDPLVIVEVLSESTEAIDRGEKWESYQRISSLEQYILLAQHAPIAEVYTRDGHTWRYERLEGDAALRFNCLDLEVQLSDLFEQLPPLE